MNNDQVIGAIFRTVLALIFPGFVQLYHKHPIRGVLMLICWLCLVPFYLLPLIWPIHAFIHVISLIDCAIVEFSDKS